MALAALGSSSDPVHDPVHAAERDDVVGSWLSLPRRIYLDTSTLQNLYDFDGEIFEGARPESRPDAGNARRGCLLGDFLEPSAGRSFLGSEVAPGGRELPDADGAAGLLGGHADGLGEGGEGELHLGELIDRHACGHGGGHDLDGFG
jgi:hypothetical protein